VSNNLKGHIALFLAQVLYAASFPIAKIVMEDIPYNVLVILRVVGAVILFWLSSLIINEKVERKDFGRLILLAIFGVAINQTLFLKGLHLTSSIDAAIMMVTTPILVLIIAAIAIKEKISFLKFSGIVIGFSGAVFLALQGINTSDSDSSFIGDLYVFINALSWGTYLVLVKPLMKKYHTITILKWTFLFGLPLVLPFGIADAVNFNWENLETKIILFALFVIVFTTFVAYLLNTYALKELSPSIAGAYIYMQPLLTALIAIYIFHKADLSWQKIISALMIFAGVYIVSMQKKV